MSENQSPKSTAAIVLELKERFGPPPVLSTESLEAYYGIMAELVDCFQPKDMVQKMLDVDLTNCTWEIKRYTRHKSLTIDRKYRQCLEYQAQRVKRLAERKNGIARDESAIEPENLAMQMFELEDDIQVALNEWREILRRTPKELDHAHALEAAIDYHERLDALLRRSMMQRDDVLEALERYENGRNLRRVSANIIDGECTPIDDQPAQTPAPVPDSLEPTQ